MHGRRASSIAWRPSGSITSPSIPGRRRAAACSSTSRASTTARGSIPRSGTARRNSMRSWSSLNPVSTFSGEHQSAERAGAASAEAIKPIRQYGDEFDAKYPLPAGIKWEWDLPEEEKERGRAIWQEFIGPYAAAAREATKAHTLYE